MRLVLDSSATLTWIYADETTEATRQVFEEVAEDGAIVPALWRLEIANSLTVAVRRGRIDAEFRRAALADLALLDITTDAEHRRSCLVGDIGAGRSLSPHALRRCLFGTRTASRAAVRDA